jgi:hypothetical protein
MEQCEPIFTDESYDGTGPTGLIVSKDLMLVDKIDDLSSMMVKWIEGRIGEAEGRNFIIMAKDDYDSWREMWRKIVIMHPDEFRILGG